MLASPASTTAITERTSITVCRVRASVISSCIDPGWTRGLSAPSTHGLTGCGAGLSGLGEQGADVVGVEGGAEDVAVVHDAGEQLAFACLQGHQLFLDGVLGDQAGDHDV